MDDVTMLAESREDKIDVVETKPCLLIRAGRGRTGGSTGLDLAIQRARHAGRRVKPLDGDLRSKTLSTLYPATGRAGWCAGGLVSGAAGSIAVRSQNTPPRKETLRPKGKPSPPEEGHKRAQRALKELVPWTS